MAIKEFDLKNGKVVKWIDVTDPTVEELEQISKQYKLHRGIVKDCLDPDHLPKYEKIKDYAFIIVRLFSGDPKQHAHSLQELTTKMAIFYNEHFLITIHRLEQPFVEEIKQQELEEEGDCLLADLVARILWYALNTFQAPALSLDEQVDRYETAIFLKTPKPALLQGLYYIKRKATVGRRTLVLTSDVISFLNATDANKNTLQDIKDLYTKLLMLYDEVVDDTNNLLSTYLSITSQKTNDVVKILTIFSLFFLPLTFIVGIYGMNFDYMPELRQKWGYPVVLGFMVVLTVLIFLWFKKKRWL